MRFVIFVVAILAAVDLRAGDSSLGGGPVYTLFNPVPDAKQRTFTPDRPNQSTGPFTVDAGHFLLEMDFANYTLDRGPADIDQWNVAPVNLRVGLLPALELDIQYAGYFNVRTRDRGTQSGFGDLSLRPKINLFGNDGGTYAFGLYPLLRLPVSTAGLASRSVEGGLGLLFAASLPGEVSLTISADFQCVRNSGDTGYVGDYLDAISLTRGLGIKHLAGFIEIASEVSSESPSAAAIQMDTGVTYQIGENTQIDLDCNFGVTRAAPDYMPFAGLAVRF